MKGQSQAKTVGPGQSTWPGATPGGQGRAADSTAKQAASVTPERIRTRAYEIFLARRGNDGDALADWLLAERELTSSHLPAGAPGVATNPKPPALDASAGGERRHS
jgi:hypothetical protein